MYRIIIPSLLFLQSCNSDYNKNNSRNELDDPEKTISFFIREAYPQLNPSIKINVDGKEAYSAKHISDFSMTDRPKIKLSYGKHTISVSPADNRYLINDTIDVARTETPYWIRVTFEQASQPLESYLNYLVGIYYRNRTEGKNLTEEEKAEELKYIRAEIMKQKEQIAKDYKPIPISHFIIDYTDDPFYQKKPSKI